MAAGTPYTRTFSRAMQALGGEENLATALGVTLEALRSWMRNDAVPPVEVFNAALDIVARGRVSRPVEDAEGGRGNDGPEG